MVKRDRNMEGQDQLDLEAFEMHLGASRVATLEGEIMLGWAGNGLTWVEA